MYPVMNNPNQDGQSSSGTSPFPGPVGVGCPRNACRVQREGCGAWYRKIGVHAEGPAYRLLLSLGAWD